VTVTPHAGSRQPLDAYGQPAQIRVRNDITDGAGDAPESFIGLRRDAAVEQTSVSYATFIQGRMYRNVEVITQARPRDEGITGRLVALFALAVGLIIINVFAPSLTRYQSPGNDKALAQCKADKSRNVVETNVPGQSSCSMRRNGWPARDEE
jgi:hypothetical protein